MPLGIEDSFVTDPTEPSSPNHEMERDDSPAPVKRVARTYGKPRERPMEVDTEDTLALISRPVSRDVVAPKAPSRSTEHIPPVASPTPTINSDPEEDGSPAASSAKFTFGWKAKLQAMDEDDDDEPTTAPTEAKSLFGKSTLLPDKPTTRAPLKNGDAQTTPPSRMDVADDVFGEPSLSSGSQSIGPKALTEQTFSLSSPPVAPRKTSRRSTAHTASDSEEEIPKHSASTSPESSQPLHNINTPKSRSAHTSPPTSEEDDMALNNTGKARQTGKKKAQQTRNVTPLNLVAENATESSSRPAHTTKRGKVKAPTKKDREEMVKERARLVAESNAVVAKDTAQKFTKTRFLEFVQERARAAAVIDAKKVEIPLSDPIETYSSPVAAPSNQIVETRVAGSPEPDSDDEELPEVSNIFAASLAQKKKAELLEKKKRLLQMQKRQTVPLPESDDDVALEIVLPNPKTGVHEEEQRRRSPQKKHISEARKQQLRLAQIGVSKMKAAKASADVHVRSAQVASGSNLLRDGKRLDQQALNRLMVSQARQEARKVTAMKEEEWTKHGGRLVEHPEAQAEGLDAAFRSIAAKAAAAQQEAGSEPEDNDEDASDEDWTPDMRGSASPEPENDGAEEGDEEAQEGEQENDENDENSPMDHDTTMVDEDDTEDRAEPKVRASRRTVVASDSEDEEDENDENAPVMTPYRRATSSAELTEGEYDKENNAFDLGENKENLAAPARTNSAFDFPPSPTQSSNATIAEARRAQWGDSLRNMQPRKPFQDLLPDDGLASPSQPSFAAKLLQSSQTPIATPGSSLKPFIGGGLQGEKSFGSFSQLFDGESDTFGSAPLLQPAFGGGLFQSKSGAADPFDDQDFENRPKAPLRRTDTLGLTQEVHAAAKLQPGFQAGDNLMRKADSIFEKEQAFLLEAAVKKPAARPELYVNDHGFLTQTRPVEGTPDVYRPSLSPSQRPRSISPSQPRIRAPLRTLSYTKPTQPDSPEAAPLRRLRKNVTPPPGGSQLDAPSPTSTPPRQRNAFDMLAHGAARARDEKKAKMNQEEIAAFLENEAAESDEDDNFGFGKAKKDDEEEDGEDLDATLDVLMDDNAMDEDTVAADLVMEKYKQQEEEYDQEVERLHQAAVQGELRRKRTRGVGIDDSDDDSEDDGNARARRAMKKLRTSDHGDIKHLEANEATRSFAQTYNQSLKDDDDEFAYLNKETQLDELMATSRAEGGDEEDEYEDDEEEEEVPQTISTHEVRRQLREAAEEGQELDDVAMNPEDVSWIEKDDDEPMARVKTVNSRQRPTRQMRNPDDGELSGLLDKPAEPTNASSKQWFNQEFKSRNAGTSRSVGGSAITGHAKAKPKPTGNTVVKARTNDSASSGKKGVRTERSMLSAIADKSRHFG